MSQILYLATLVARQEPDEATTTVPLAGTPGHCETGNEYNGNMGVRISAIFVILVGSLFGGLAIIYLVTQQIRLTIDRGLVSSLHAKKVKWELV